MNRVNAALAGLVGALGAAWAASRLETEASAYTVTDLPIIGEAVRLVDGLVGYAVNPDVQSMYPSSGLYAQLKRSEGGPLLERTDLGDGGYTIGFGRFERSAHLLPARITHAEADTMFRVDVERRGAHWVRAYVTVPLTQEQFDALTSMAYNLRPSSFRKIAEAVNRGESPDAVAYSYTRPGSAFERGLRNRRAAELALFHQGVYTV